MNYHLIFNDLLKHLQISWRLAGLGRAGSASLDSKLPVGSMSATHVSHPALINGLSGTCSFVKGTEVRQSEPNWAGLWQISSCIIFAASPLTKEATTAEARVKGEQSSPIHCATRASHMAESNNSVFILGSGQKAGSEYLPKSNLRASLVAQLTKNLPAMSETSVWFLDWKGLLEKG